MTHDYAKVQYIPSLATQRKLVYVPPFEDQFEQRYAMPHSANPANTVPVPAERNPDLQSYFFGAMTHSLTLRPYRPIVSCLSCCKGADYKFDLAADAFGPAFAEGEINAGCCSNVVTVKLPNTTLRGEISTACCSLQRRVNLEWQSGENMSYRAMPCITCCGPWRTGFVGTAPGEEEQHNIRFWSNGGGYYTCDMSQCCFPCKLCVSQCQKDCCDCTDEFGYTTWQPPTLEEMRASLLARYSFALRSSFGEIVYDKKGPYDLVGQAASAHKSDVNALGSVRVRQRKNACCKFVLSDPSDSTDISSATGFDLTFRGTFNQNQLDPKDFNLALGYLILNAKFFLDIVAPGSAPHMAAMNTLPGAFFLLQRADVRPNHAIVSGNKMV
jgi:hypothetical protein